MKRKDGKVLEDAIRFLATLGKKLATNDPPLPSKDDLAGAAHENIRREQSQPTQDLS